MVKQRKIVLSNHAKQHQADKTIAFLVTKRKTKNKSNGRTKEDGVE